MSDAQGPNMSQSWLDEMGAKLDAIVGQKGKAEMPTATIFYVNEQWLSGQDNPFGARYGSQILPMGSVVVGFMRWNGQRREVEELLDDMLFVAPNQEQSWNDTLGEARAVVRGLPVLQ